MTSRRTAVPSEAHLALLWAAQPFSQESLTTRDGRAIAVLHPGRPGGLAGPDFRDAVLQFDGALPVVGDVELHRDAADFVRHGHQADSAYDRLALHVVFQGGDATGTVLASGRTIPIVAVPAHTCAAPVGREPCAAAVAHAGSAAVSHLLEQAGLWRMQRKALDLIASIQVHGPAQALYRALAVALGQTANAAAFGLLADRLPLVLLLRDMPSAFDQGATAATTDGAIPAGNRTEADSRAGAAASHEGIWSLNRCDKHQPAAGSTEAHGHQPAVATPVALVTQRLRHMTGLDGALLGPAPALPFVTSGLRPAAMPARRIAALAVLVVRLGGVTLASVATALIDRALAGGGRSLLPVLMVRSHSGSALCGPSRAVELAINALLPWAAARALLACDDNRADDILRLAAALPAGEPYRPTAHLARNLRDARGRRLITNALRQQGALALNREWCRRGGCGRCPLS